MVNRFRALGRSTLPHFVRPPQLTRGSSKHSGGHVEISNSIPTGPSCSRWFSCTCCHLNASKPPSPTSQNAHGSAENHGRADSEHSARTSADGQDSVTTLLSTGQAADRAQASPKSPYSLPLPPKLPYSPNSIPFKRHLEILSQSINKAPPKPWLIPPSPESSYPFFTSHRASPSRSLDNEHPYSHPSISWSIYYALDPSLRSHVPDDLFCSLIRHQLQTSDEKERTKRVSQLMIFAHQCQMDFKLLGLKTLEEAILLKYRWGKTGLHETLQTVWDNIVLLRKQDLSRCPLEVRLTRLRWMTVRYTHDTVRTKAELGEEAWSALEQVIGMGGAVGVGPVVQDLLEWDNRSADPRVHLSIVRKMGILWQHGIRMSDVAMKPSLKRLVTALGGKRGLVEAQKLVDEIKEENREAADHVETLERAWTSTRRHFMTRTEIASEVARLVERRHNHLQRRAISALNDLYTSDAGAKIDAALDLLDNIVNHRHGNAYPLISKIIASLWHIRASPQYMVPRLQRLVNIFLPSGILPTLSTGVLTRILVLLTYKIHTRMDYILCQKLYTIARAADPPMSWTLHTLHWIKLFRAALDLFKRPSVHFASRLYADYAADGMSVAPNDLLHFIRVVASHPSASRMILLERHLKDFAFGDVGPTLDLIRACTDGLCTTKDPDDAWLAYTLSMRLLQGEPLPVLECTTIIDVLVSQRRMQDLWRCVTVMKELPTSKRGPIIDRILRAASSPDHLLFEPERDSECLSLARTLYDDMLTKGIQPSLSFLSRLVRELALAGHPLTALQAFVQCDDRGIRLHLQTVGALVVRLAMKNRFQEARDVLLRSGRLYKEAPFELIGARAFLDVKAGRKVTVEDIERQTGYDVTEFVDAARGVPKRRSWRQAVEERTITAEPTKSWSAVQIPPKEDEDVTKPVKSAGPVSKHNIGEEYSHLDRSAPHLFTGYLAFN